MRVVVIGGTGNLGLQLVRRLARTPDVEVVGVARRAPEGSPVPGARFLEADVTTDDLVPLLRGADVVVHLAWLIQPTRAPGRLWDVNAVGTARVLAAASQAGVGAVVHASSVGAYSPGPSDRFVDESWPTHGIGSSAYSREKAYAERLLDVFEREHPAVRVVRFRPALIMAGESASHARRLFLGSLVPNALLRPEFLPVVPRVQGLALQAVHAVDVADAFARAVVSDVTGAFNLAAAPVLDADALAEVVGARTVPLPAGLARAAVRASWVARLQPVDPGWLDLAIGSPLLDSSRARRDLGWVPTRSSQDTIREVLEHLADGRGGPTPVLTPDADRSRVVELSARQGAREMADDGVTA